MLSQWTYYTASMNATMRFRFRIWQLLSLVVLLAVGLWVRTIVVNAKTYDVGERHVLLLGFQGAILIDESSRFIEVVPVGDMVGSLVYIEESYQLQKSLGGRRFCVAIQLAENLRAGDAAAITTIAGESREKMLQVGKAVAWESTSYPPQNLWLPDHQIANQVVVLETNELTTRCRCNLRFKKANGEIFDFSKTITLRNMTEFTSIDKLPWNVRSLTQYH